MEKNSTVVPFQHPDDIDDALSAILRSGARRLLAQAVEAEAEAFLEAMREERLAMVAPGSFGVATAPSG